MANQRHKHLKRLGGVMYSVRYAYISALGALVEALPETHARAYRACVGKPNITSDYFTEWEQNQASDILKELYEFGLLTRYETIDENGKHYNYNVFRVNDFGWQGEYDKR